MARRLHTNGAVKHHLALSAVLLCASCAHAPTPALVPSEPFSDDPYFKCSTDDAARIEHAELRFVALGWVVTRATDAYLQTAPQGVTSLGRQRHDLATGQPVERELIDVVVARTSTGDRFSVAITTESALLRGRGHVQSIDRRALAPNTRVMWNLIRWAACGDPDPYFQLVDGAAR